MKSARLRKNIIKLVIVSIIVMLIMPLSSAESITHKRMAVKNKRTVINKVVKQNKNLAPVSSVPTICPTVMKIDFIAKHNFFVLNSLKDNDINIIRAVRRSIFDMDLSMAKKCNYNGYEVNTDILITDISKNNDDTYDLNFVTKNANENSFKNGEHYFIKVKHNQGESFSGLIPVHYTTIHETTGSAIDMTDFDSKVSVLKTDISEKLNIYLLSYMKNTNTNILYAFREELFKATNGNVIYLDYKQNLDRNVLLTDMDNFTSNGWNINFKDPFIKEIAVEDYFHEESKATVIKQPDGSYKCYIFYTSPCINSDETY